MTNQERIEALQEAQEKINEAIELIKMASEGTSFEGMTNSYIIGHLKTWANSDNSFEKGTIPQLLEQLDNGGEEE